MTHSDCDVQKPEFEAIVEGRTGACFEAGNVSDLTRKLTEFNDPKRQLFMRENCLKMIDSFYHPKYQYDIICKAVDGEFASKGDVIPCELFD